MTFVCFCNIPNYLNHIADCSDCMRGGIITFDVFALGYHLLKISGSNSDVFLALNRISVTVERLRKGGVGRRAAPKWLFHLYASAWLRGVLLKDKDWPLRLLLWLCVFQQQYQSLSTLLYNTTVTDQMQLTQRARFSGAGSAPCSLS